MVEITNNRCFVLWTKNNKGKVSFQTTVYTNAHAAISEGERQKAINLIQDYMYSVVMEPQIGGEMPKPKMSLDNRQAKPVELQL